MKLTKKQVIELLNCHIGVGAVIYKSAENEITKFDFYTGKNNKVMKISDLKTPEIDLSKEVSKNCDFEE